MKYIFRKWSREYKEIIDFDGKDNCENLHKKRELYFVVAVQNNSTPYCFIEINNTFLLVGFLDELNREYLTYEFEEYEPEKIFLIEAHYWDYEKTGDEKIFSTHYFFTRERSLRIIKTDLLTNESEILNSKKVVDISGNYDHYPEFNKYQNIIKLERLSI